ncbi:helix-turn-helix domain-containing protein [Dethiothermospora halolimnae]|uniref:helix-turn-helix domain-containing protein n=1 Tax=Dethiothermospora halolimnae TaxID=3114390 RepID=UPI003CCC357C
MNFGFMLKCLRSNAGLNQKQLADILNISHQSISAYETNRREPDFKTLEKIADYFNVSIDFLLGRTDDPNLVKLEGQKLPKELIDLGVEYVTVLKEFKDKGLSPNDIKKIINIITKE